MTLGKKNVYGSVQFSITAFTKHTVKPRYFERRGSFLTSVQYNPRHCGGAPALKREIRKSMRYLERDP